MGYSGGKGRGSPGWCEWEFWVRVDDIDSRPGWDELWGGIPIDVDVKSFASSWIEGSFVASDARRETEGDKYPSSLDVRRSSLDATINNDNEVLPDDMLYDVPKRELLDEEFDAME